MRGIVLSLFLMICALNSFAQTQIAKKTSYGRGYLEYVPADYASSSTLYPCIVFLHGAGERGDGSPAALEKVKAQGVPKFIKNGSTMCFTVNGKTECFIVLSPQQTTAKWSWTGDVIPFMKWALANYKIDPDRLYLTGLSMGGGWDTTYDTQNDPNLIAAFVPVSTTGDYHKAKLTAAKKIHVWAFHGDKDTSFTLHQGKSPVNGMIIVGANPAPIWTVVAGGTHSSNTWDKVYSPTHTYYSPNIYEWFLTKKRYNSGAPPVANAGPDKNITLPTNTVVLSGIGSDSDGQIMSYSWKQVSGPAVTTTSLTEPELTLSNCTEGSYKFSLTVTDNENKTAVDSTTITVEPSINQPPVADAGADRLITLPTNSAVLTGSGVDSDGQIINYEWKQSSGPTAATTTELDKPALTVSNCTQGKYTFVLTVTDNNNETAVDSTSITIVSNTNQAPTVNAGSDKWITLPITTTTLTAVANDIDGSVVSYQWVKTWGPAATLNNANTPTLSIVGSTAGTYTFRVTVTDDKGLKSSDVVNVTIKKALPVANAGIDQQITAPVSEATLQGSGTDPDGTIASYSWTQSSGPAALISNPTLPTIHVSQLTIEGQYVFMLTVTDNDNQKASDFVTINVIKQATSQSSSARSSAGQTETVQVQESSSVEESSSMVTGLNQNYPNPFTNTTTIPFSIKNDQRVVVKVYDFYGAEIQTLVNEELKAGEHTVAFTPAIPNQFFLIKLVADGKMHSMKAIQL